MKHFCVLVCVFVVCRLASASTELIVPGDTWAYHNLNLSSKVASAPETDDSTWWTGNAPFGNTPNPDFAYKTLWPEGTMLWVRKSLSISGPADLRAYIGIDNRFELYWNGVLIREESSTGRAARWNSVVDIPASVVRPGKNVIALRLIDQGFETAFDMKLITRDDRIYATNLADGHCFVAISTSAGITYDDAAGLAEDMTMDGVHGHLATIASADENAFVARSFPNANGYWLGGRQTSKEKEPSSDWRWVTSEPWDYSNWAPGEPNNQDGIEDVLEWKTGGWNDATTSARLQGYIVEFDIPKK